MELVEGRTLAELIPGAGLPLSTLLDLAIPVAEAIRDDPRFQALMRSLA